MYNYYSSSNSSSDGRRSSETMPLTAATEAPFEAGDKSLVPPPPPPPEASPLPYYGRQSIHHRSKNAMSSSYTNPTFSTTEAAASYNDYDKNRNNGTESSKQQSNSHVQDSDLLTSTCLTICVVIVFCCHPSLVQLSLVASLVLYILDLANLSRYLLLTGVILTILVMSIWQAALPGLVVSDVRFTGFLLQLWMGVLLWSSVAIHVAAVLLMASSESSTLLTRQLQRLLSGLVPLLTAAWCTTAVIEFSTVSDTIPVAAPLTFGGVLALVSFLYQQQQQQQENSRKATPWIHAIVLASTPLLLHLSSCWNRMITQFVGMDDLYELVIVSTLPLLLYCIMSERVGWKQSMPSRFSYMRLVVVSLLCWFSIQQRYLLAITHSFSYHFLGRAQSVTASTLYGLASVLCTLFSASVWNSQTNLFGDYQEDAVQLGLALAGLFVGKLFGLPWNFTPLPILAFLGLTLWMATRMLRYLVIFLFVVHATGMVVFTYRFAGMDDIRINVVGVIQKMTLMRFGFAVVLSSVLVGLVAGLAIRSTGGAGYQLIKKFHGVGALMALYSLILMALEITLLKRPVPTNELAGVEFDADEIEESSTLYRHFYSIGTAFVLIALTAYMQRIRIVAPSSALVLFSVNLGKALCVWMDSVSSIMPLDDESGFKLFLRSIVATVLIWVMFAPQALLSPLHSKIKRRRSSLTVAEIPSEARRTIYLYAGFVLPLTLLSAIPMVLFPLAGVLADTYQNGFYATVTFSSRSLPIVELVASTVAIWGLACLSMLNHYLPEETTGQGLKKLAAFAFLIGTLLFLVSPLLGSGVSAKALAQNPYAAMSSLGSQLMRGKQRSGAWGLLAAALATLLALSGPLELRERRVVAATTGHAKKDRFLLLRTMIFGLLFGGGVSWFVVLQNLRDVELGALVFLGMSCLSVACMGTVAAVLGYFLDLEGFDDAEQVIQFTVILTAALLPVSGISTLFTEKRSHWFGSDGWLSTYLVVVSLTYFAMAVCLRHRPTKNAKTCAVANTLGVASWGAALAILYGRYGASGLDSNYDIRLILGCPASVVGTFVLSPMLLVLEGEASASRRSVVGRISSGRTGGGVASSSSIGMSLPRLRPSNRFYPLFIGSISVFLLASLYVICLRGSGWFGFVGGPVVAKSPVQVFQNVYGDTADNMNQDLATLARLAISHSNALMTSAQLAGSGFWTSSSWMGPLLHLAGILCCFPTLHLHAQRSWFGKMVPLTSVVFALPLLVIPLLLCRGIDLLRWAALLCLAAGSSQAWLIRRIQHESNMRI